MQKQITKQTGKRQSDRKIIKSCPKTGGVTNVSNAYYELRNHIGNTRFNETSTNILLSNNYYISSNYRKNLDTDKSESASFSINYENDCIRYSLSTDKTFYLDKDLKPDRTITFNIIIKPYGEGFAPDLSKFID